jgi:hypothetical protein
LWVKAPILSDVQAIALTGLFLRAASHWLGSPLDLASGSAARRGSDFLS